VGGEQQLVLISERKLESMNRQKTLVQGGLLDKPIWALCAEIGSRLSDHFFELVEYLPTLQETALLNAVPSLFLLSRVSILPRSAVYHSSHVLTILCLKARASYHRMVSLTFIFTHLRKLNFQEIGARPLNDARPLSAPFLP
jgi:hypothetical protein